MTGNLLVKNPPLPPPREGNLIHDLPENIPSAGGASGGWSESQSKNMLALPFTTAKFLRLLDLLRPWLESAQLLGNDRIVGVAFTARA